MRKSIFGKIILCSIIIMFLFCYITNSNSAHVCRSIDGKTRENTINAHNNFTENRLSRVFLRTRARRINY